MSTNAPSAQDLGEARKRLGLLTRARPRRRSTSSRTQSISFKGSLREARALRVMARELDVPSETGAVLLRVFSLTEVLAMYERHLAERRSA